MAAALMIAEFARRHIARGATGAGSSASPRAATSAFRGGFLRCREGRPGSYTMSAALELARFGITANMVHPPVTDTGWVTDAVRAAVAASPALFHVPPARSEGVGGRGQHVITLR